MNDFDIPKSFWGHVEELQRTLIQVLVVILIGTGCTLFFYQELFAFLTSPLHQIKTSSLTHHEIKRERLTNPGPEEILFSLPTETHSLLTTSSTVRQVPPNAYAIPAGGYIEFDRKVSPHNLIIFGPIEGMMITLKTSFWLALVGTSPIWMFLILKFIAPALRAQEQRLLIPFLGFSLLFMILGFLFAFFVTIPLGNQYLAAFNQGIGINLWSLSNYLDYTVSLLLANGLAFALCVILLFLVHYGIVSSEALSGKRRHLVVLAFILGALLTPPDILTQFMLATPLIVLYELMILYARWRCYIRLDNTDMN